jgi:hypothetical protein
MMHELGIRTLSNGTFVPINFDLDNIEEYQLKEKKCKQLKKELSLELQNTTLTKIKELFEKKGHEYIVDMFKVDPWQNVNIINKSILEFSLEKVNFQVSHDIMVFLIEYFIKHSEQAKSTNMNPLHVLARNCCFSDHFITLLKTMVEKHPEWLKDRMNVSEDLDMNPVEMAIRTSHNQELINLMITKYQETFGFTLEDKNKLLLQANWLRNSGACRDSSIGKRIVQQVETLPIIHE